MIEVKGFHINSPGDPSVGIQPVNWTLNGGFEFDTFEELTAFKYDLTTLFHNHVSDDVWVETFEEREQFLEVERKYYPPLGDVEEGEYTCEL